MNELYIYMSLFNYCVLLSHATNSPLPQLDMGMTDLLRPSLYGARHPIVVRDI